MNRPSVIRIMVVDDEAPARSELVYLLEQHPDVCVVCQASNYQDALTLVRQCNPHLLFLDIEMPGLNGVQIAEKILETLQPFIVFATAHEEYALKAFDMNAVDYLLKPFSASRVGQCIDKVRKLIASRAQVELEPRETTADCSSHRDKLAVEHGGKAHILKTSEILAACSSEGNVDIYTADKIYHANMPLADLHSRLDEAVFFRSHRGCIINIEKVREIIPWFNGTYNILLEGLPSTEFPVSRQQAPKLKRMFDL